MTFYGFTFTDTEAVEFLFAAVVLGFLAGAVAVAVTAFYRSRAA